MQRPAAVAEQVTGSAPRHHKISAAAPVHAVRQLRAAVQDEAEAGIATDTEPAAAAAADTTAIPVTGTVREAAHVMAKEGVAIARILTEHRTGDVDPQVLQQEKGYLSICSHQSIQGYQMRQGQHPMSKLHVLNRPVCQGHLALPCRSSGPSQVLCCWLAKLALNDEFM